MNRLILTLSLLLPAPLVRAAAPVLPAMPVDPVGMYLASLADNTCYSTTIAPDNRDDMAKLSLHTEMLLGFLLPDPRGGSDN